jgi:hypothetical protein
MMSSLENPLVGVISWPRGWSKDDATGPLECISVWTQSFATAPKVSDFATCVSVGILTPKRHEMDCLQWRLLEAQIFEVEAVCDALIPSWTDSWNALCQTNHPVVLISPPRYRTPVSTHHCLAFEARSAPFGRSPSARSASSVVFPPYPPFALSASVRNWTPCKKILVSPLRHILPKLC